MKNKPADGAQGGDVNLIAKKICCMAAAAISVLTAAQTLAASAQGGPSPSGTGTCTLTIPVSVKDSSGNIPEGTVFTFELTAENGAPLPEQTLAEVTGSGEFEFGPIVFDEPDNYEYTVFQRVWDSDDIIFDETVYHVHAAVLYNEADELVCGISLTAEDSDAKPTEVVFSNDCLVDEDNSLPEDDSDKSTGSGNSPDGSSLTQSRDDSWKSFITPNTGGAVAIGFTGLAAGAVAVILLRRRRGTDDDEPPDKESG